MLASRSSLGIGSACHRMAAAAACMMIGACAPLPGEDANGEVSSLSGVEIPAEETPGVANLASYSSRSLAFHPDSALARFASDALAANATRSAAEGLVAQRVAELNSLRWERRPTVQPVASTQSNGTSSVGIGVSAAFIDFGRSQARVNQATVAVEGAEVQRWEEHNEAVQTTLLHVINAAEARQLLNLSTASQEAVQKLLKLAEARVASQVADRSETELISLRESELQSDVERDQAQLDLSLALLSDTIDRRVGLAEIPGFANIGASMMTGTEDGFRAPVVVQTEVERRIADLRVAQAEAERWPRILVSAQAVNDGDETETLASVSLDSAYTQLFSANDNLQAARSALASAEASAFRTRHEVETERDRLRLDAIRLRTQRRSLGRLVEQSIRSAALFEDQQAVGARPLTDGITVLRTMLQAERDLATTEASLLEVAIRLAGIEGRLAKPIVNP